MSTEPESQPPAAPQPPRSRATPEDMRRFADEDMMSRALDEDRLRGEQPPHYR